jgi:gliding motility-associated protein GldM
MYIVLTALLALNVSAEVLQAFFSMEKSLDESSRLVGGSNEQLASAIGEQADVYRQFEPFKEKAKQAQTIAQSFSGYVGELKAEIVQAAGGFGKDGTPVRKADKDITTRLLVNNGKGEELKSKISETREQLLALVDEPEARAQLAERIPLKINDVPAGSDKKSWAQFTFQQMPVAAVMPILSKFQNDVMVAETAILNHFADKMNIQTVRPDKFAPVISTDNSYVIRGEEFKGEIFLASYSSTADNIAITVDGRPLRVDGGRAVFTANPSAIGVKTHEMSIRLSNPLTGQTETFKKQFSYEVGERSVAVSADKMNVLYIGVENPISVSAAGVPSGKLSVVAEGITLTPKGNGKFVAVPKTPGKASVRVSGGGLQPTAFEYRVKRIPDPVMMLGKSKGGPMTAGEFKAYNEITPVLEGFDFDARCTCEEFELVRVRKGDAATALNKTGKYGTETRRIVDGVQRGDICYFENIKVRCPGETHLRKMPVAMFNIR